MLEFFKLFGQGILYTILSPFILAYFAIFLAYTMLNYLVCEVYSVVSFFFGGGCSKKTKLERELEKQEMSVLIEKEKTVTLVNSGTNLGADNSSPYEENNLGGRE